MPAHASVIPATAEAERAASDVLAAHEAKALLRFITCGSVDDGKSTLIGRLLYDTKLIAEDQLAGLERDSRRYGTTGEDIDLALLVDGLEAEREQGITIDVAYRFFATDRAKFIVADTPGHEEYTRNMVTGASTADVAIILIDARKGVLVQTRRHAFIASLLGIRHVVLAVNKMDLIGNDRASFEAIVADFREHATMLDFETITPIPLSARWGDNVIGPSGATPWYAGPSLLDHLENEAERVGREGAAKADAAPFRMPVQWVNRPNLDYRGFSGTIASGTVRPGDRLVVTGSGRASTVREITTMDGNLDAAGSGRAVTIRLADEIDASRGDVLATADDRPEVSDQFQAHIVWMDENELLPGRPYALKIGTRTVTAQVTEIKHQVDVNTHDHLAAKTLGLNGVGVVNLSLSEPIAFEPYGVNHTLGGFIIIDRLTNRTVAAGMIDFALRRATNVHWQSLDVDKAMRASLKSQKPAVLWFTGLSGAGKSTVANLVDKRLIAMGRHTTLLDGDNVRHGLNRDLGFTDADRVENIRRVAETAKLMVDAGLIVLASFISPFRAERRLARDLLEEGEFFEVHVDVPLRVAESRDPKGLYKRARAGEIANFTGIDSPYEPPENAELTLNSAEASPEELAERVVEALRERGYLG